jgi:hypothetical protein
MGGCKQRGGNAPYSYGTLGVAVRPCSRHIHGLLFSIGQYLRWNVVGLIRRQVISRVRVKVMGLQPMLLVIFGSSVALDTQVLHRDD